MDFADPMLVNPSVVAAVGAALMAVGLRWLHRSRVPAPGSTRPSHEPDHPGGG